MSERVRRRSVLAAIGVSAVGLAGCLEGEEETDDPEESSVGDREFTLESDFDPVFVGDSPPTDEPDDAPPFSDRTRPIPLSVEELSERATDGGPPQDGIPSVDDPEFVSPVEAGFLVAEMPVLGIVRDGQAKAYPRRVLVHHEIVNDELEGTPISLTYCPLTGTAQAFERGDTEFGVSRMLINNNLVMYDRKAERWWPQIPAVSIPGPWHETDGGAALREFNVVRTTWEQWRDVYPDTLVMSERTGFARDYEFDSYQIRGYYDSSSTPFENTHTDDTYHAKEWVYGVRTSEGAAAFRKESLHEVGLIEGTIGETPVVAVHDQSLDTAHVYANPDGDSFTDDRGTVIDDQNTSTIPTTSRSIDSVRSMPTGSRGSRTTRPRQSMRNRNAVDHEGGDR
ncbi:DUF3179 domain-containing protein [Natrialbaceae archaeon A-arb3/5]